MKKRIRLILIALVAQLICSCASPAEITHSSPQPSAQTPSASPSPNSPIVQNTPYPLPLSQLPLPSTEPVAAITSTPAGPLCGLSEQPPFVEQTPAVAELPSPSVLEQTPIPVYGYEIVQSYPHDRSAFTQGLIYDQGSLYEGTGQEGQSTLRKVELETGRVLQICSLDPTLFGEGIAAYQDKLIQLTWQSHIGFVYDKASFKLLRTFNYPTEGWGITFDGARLIRSDGTAMLYFLDPNTLVEQGSMMVYDDHGPVYQLNELEYVNGEILANVWQTDRIARIDPSSGRVRGWIDLTGLLGPEDRQQPVDVLNGIAYDSEHDRLFVTGKWWPKLFEIKLVERQAHLIHTPLITVTRPGTENKGHMSPNAY